MREMFRKFIGKNQQQSPNNAFAKHGFMKQKDSNKKVYVMVSEAEYAFDFETNIIYEIPSGQIKFAICVRNGKRILFTNKNYILEDGTTRPYRTFYDGLMKEPFKFCFPFGEQVNIVTEEGYRLLFFIKGN